MLQSHLKQLWGTAEPGFLEVEEGYYYTFSFQTDYKYKSQSLTFTYLDSRLDKQTMPCAALYWEFTAKLLSSSDLYLSDI